MIARFSRFFLGLSVLFLVMGGHARAEAEAVADLSEDFIPVTEDFDGARVTVFGALRSSKSDVVVTFEGMPARAAVRSKVKKLGVWINDAPLFLEPVPSFYALLSSRPMVEILKRDKAMEAGIGLFSPLFDQPAGRGLIDNRRAKGLYTEVPDGVKIRDKKLFRADLYLPPNIPVGTYQATVYEIKNGAIVASRVAPVKVAPVGIASAIRNLAANHASFYAALCVALMLLVGGAQAYLFRRPA